MSVIFLDEALVKQKERRDRAKARAKELVAFLQEECEANDAIPQGVNPGVLLDSIAEVFYETETIRDQLFSSLPER